MKKLIAVVLFLSTFGIVPSFADTVTPSASPTPMPTITPTENAVPGSLTFPSSANNQYLDGQIIATIANHGSYSSEIQRGSRRTILSDNLIEAGHLKGQYIGALDGSLYSNPQKTGLFPFDYEAGIRLNVNTIVNNYVTFTPQWAGILGNLEYYVRSGYDFGQDKTHAWFGSVNLALGFGPGAGVTVSQ